MFCKQQPVNKIILVPSLTPTQHYVIEIFINYDQDDVMINFSVLSSV